MKKKIPTILLVIIAALLWAFIFSLGALSY